MSQRRHVRASVKAQQPPPEGFCLRCGVEPRAAGGRLTRCFTCLRADVDQERRQREALQARADAKTAKPKAARTKAKRKSRIAQSKNERHARDAGVVDHVSASSRMTA